MDTHAGFLYAIGNSPISLTMPSNNHSNNGCDMCTQIVIGSGTVYLIQRSHVWWRTWMHMSATPAPVKMLCTSLSTRCLSEPKCVLTRNDPTRLDGVLAQKWGCCIQQIIAMFRAYSLSLNEFALWVAIRNNRRSWIDPLRAKCLARLLPSRTFNDWAKVNQ